MSEFQIGLLVLGALVLLAVLLQSLWSARANAPRQAQGDVPEPEGWTQWFPRCLEMRRWRLFRGVGG